MSLLRIILFSFFHSSCFSSFTPPDSQMMTCAVDSSSGSFPHPGIPQQPYHIPFYYTQPQQQQHQEEFVLLEDNWLQTEIYHDFVLPAAVGSHCSSGCCCSSSTTSLTPTDPATLLGRPQNKLSSLGGAPGLAAGASTGPKAPPWWETELSRPIHETLRQREEAIGKIQFKSPQLLLRRELIEFVTAVSKDLGLSDGTRYLSIRLADHFMDGHNVMEYRLRLMGLTCLLLAGEKY